MSFKPSRIGASFIAFLTAAAVLSHPVKADPLPEPLQTKREENNAISTKACTGDANAIAEVRRRLAANDPMMMNSAGYLKSECDSFSSLTSKQVADYQRRSALAGYPIGMANYGLILLRGEHGVQQDKATAMALLDRAIDAGYGIAARNLAFEYASGRHLPQDVDKARAYLQRAAAEQVSARLLASAEKRIVQAKEEAAVREANRQNGDIYAALAVSTGDAVFGFAHDYADSDDAARRARDECRERGGASCDVKLILRGPACIAYRYEPGASVFGWGFSKSQSAAEDRAALECSNRNSDRQCSADAWACNERSNAPIETVLSKELPPVTGTTADSGDSCVVILSHTCNNFNDARNLAGRVQPSTFVAHFSDEKISVPGCNENTRIDLNWKWTKNRWGNNNQKDLPTEIVAQIKRILMQYRARVRAEIPNCKTNPKENLDATYMTLSGKNWYESRRKDEARHKSTGNRQRVYLE